MSRASISVGAMLLAAAMQTVVAQPDTARAERLLAGAAHKATIDGDLRGAIAEYRKALAAAGTDRSLAVRALMRMAECHQTLGDPEARAIYERVVREFADQAEHVALARARLGAGAAPQPARGDRSVWTGPDVDGFGTVSPDGRYATYTDWTGGANLMLRDLVLGTSHRLTTGGTTQYSAISKDGAYVAYQWRDRDAPRERRHYELRVARLSPTGLEAPRLLFANADVLSAAPHDWSRDGQWIATAIDRVDGVRQIGIIRVADGGLRVLKSLDWREPIRIFFSPDGRFIAYDLPPDGADDQRHVFVMAVDASTESAVVAHPSQNVVMGWSPDGRHLLFSSDRSGTFSLWAAPIENGRASRAATLVKTDISSSWSLGITAGGTMHVWKAASPVYVQASAVDLARGRIGTAAPAFQRFITSRGRPEWSADGRQLAFQSCGPLGAGPCSLWIRSMETGEERELKVSLGYFFYLRWSPDGRELLTRGSDHRGRNNGLYRIDARSGAVTLVAAPFPGESIAQWSPDGQHVRYRRGALLIERHVASGAERTVAELPGPAPREVVSSPDGASVAYTSLDAAGESAVWVLPPGGEKPRQLLRGMPRERIFQLQWTSGGQVLTVVRETGNRRRHLWAIPADGQPPRQLALDVTNWWIEDGYSFDRAGRQIAFVGAAGQPGMEIRALENFLPARAADR